MKKMNERQALEALEKITAASAKLNKALYEFNSVVHSYGDPEMNTFKRVLEPDPNAANAFELTQFNERRMNKMIEVNDARFRPWAASDSCTIGEEEEDDWYDSECTIGEEEDEEEEYWNDSGCTQDYDEDYHDGGTPQRDWASSSQDC